MLRLLLSGICLAISCWPLSAQNKYWELSDQDLAQMVQQAEVIVEGKLGNKTSETCYKIAVTEIFQGPQKIITLVCTIPDEQAKAIGTENAYLFFIKKEKETFQLLTNTNAVLKSDLFLSSRLRKQAIKARIDKSDVVVLATVQELQEELVDKSIAVKAQCKATQTYKGTVAESFALRYVRVAKAVPPMVLLFQDLNYLFFLKRGQEPQTYELVNPYEGAYPERRAFVDEIKLATGGENPLDQKAGKDFLGLKAYSQVPTTLVPNEAWLVKVLLHNVSGAELVIYQQQIDAFVTFQVFDEAGKPVTAKALKREVPGKPEPDQFVKLGPEEYIVMPESDLQQYFTLAPGKYSLYVEFKLLDQYAGKEIGQNGWVGQIVSNKAEFQVLEK